MYFSFERPHDAFISAYVMISNSSLSPFDDKTSDVVLDAAGRYAFI